MSNQTSNIHISEEAVCQEEDLILFTDMFTSDGLPSPLGKRVCFYEQTLKQVHPHHKLTPSAVRSIESRIKACITRLLEPMRNMHEWEMMFRKEFDRVNSYKTDVVGDMIWQMIEYGQPFAENVTAQSLAEFMDNTDGFSENIKGDQWFWYCFDHLPNNDVKLHCRSQIKKAFYSRSSPLTGRFEDKTIFDTFVFDTFVIGTNVQLSDYTRTCIAALVDYVVAEVFELSGNQSMSSWAVLDQSQNHNKQLEKLNKEITHLNAKLAELHKPKEYVPHKQYSLPSDPVAQQEITYLINAYNTLASEKYEHELSEWVKSFEALHCKLLAVVEKKDAKEKAMRLALQHQFESVYILEMTKPSADETVLLVYHNNQDEEIPVRDTITAAAMEQVLEDDKQLDAYLRP